MAKINKIKLPDGVTYDVQDTVSGYVSTEATTSAKGLMSASDKTKLNGIASGAEVNQNAFSNIKVGSTTVAADTKTDTLEFVAGDNVILTPDATNDKITISSELPPTTKSVDNLPQPIASFSDGADAPLKSLTASIVPVQDLHGYDSPWAGGAGKNKYPILIGADVFNDNQSATHSNDNGILVINATATNNSGCYSNINSTIRTFVSSYTGEVTYSFDIKASANTDSLVGYESKGYKQVSLTTSWQRVSITTNVNHADTPNFVIYNRSREIRTIQVKDFMFELGSVAHDYEPYSNICPISGWTGCEVIDDAVYGGFIDWNQLVNVSGFPSGELYGITYVNNDSNFTINGTATSAVYLNIVPNFQNLLNNNHIYLFCPNISDTSQPIAMTDSYNGQIQIKNSAIVKKSSWNTFWLAYYIPNGSTITNVVITPQVYDLTQLFGETKANEIYAMEQAEAGSGVAYFKSLFYKDYYPYNSGEVTNVSAVNNDTDKYTTTTIPFVDGQGQSVEVFGGECDVVNGGEQPRTLGSVDLGELEWGYDANIRCWNITIQAEWNMKGVSNNQQVANATAEQFKLRKASGMSTSVAGELAVDVSMIRVNTGSDNEAPKGLLVYELATPTTFYTQPTSIKSLDGENNVSASTGQIEELEYLTQPYTGITANLAGYAYESGKASIADTASSVAWTNVTEKPSTYTPASHTHGNIQNGGTLQTNDVTIASGDKLVVTDSSDSNKVARTSVSFDGSTATKCLTQKGTWESFSNNTGTVTSVKVGTTSYTPSSGVVSLPAYPTTLPASDTTSTYSSTGTAPVNGKAVAAALGTLDGTVSGSAGAGKTLTAFSQTDGKVSATFGNISITKSQVSDFPTSMPASDVYSWAKASSKPSYSASEVGAIATTAKGAANGVAELDANGLVPSSQLPSYVDDVLEYSTKSSFPTTGETGKIYVDISTNLTYRWSGTAYVEISPSLALGTTSSTAYRGDYGNTAYTHATDANRLTTAKSEGLYKIATTAEGHIKSVTAVAKSDITGLGIPGSDTNTHRPIQVNGTQILGDNTTALNLKAGNNVSVTNSSGTVTIAATDTKYTATTTSIGSASAGTAIAADDITAWSANTPTSCTISQGVLTFTAGSAASLSYTARSIPNISVTSKTVATGITAS